MSREYKNLSIIGVTNGEYWFWTCYGLAECREEYEISIKNKQELKGILIDENKVGDHVCNKSALWDDMHGYIDTLQNENELSDDLLYIVTYYKYITEPLEQLVDYGITKQQIIDNINNQKYVEGADYYMMEQLTQLEQMD